MIKKFCDRCAEEIPDDSFEYPKLHFTYQRNGSTAMKESKDLCRHCRSVIIDTIEGKLK